MRAKEFINLMEYINKDVMSLGFSDEQSVLDNKFIIKAETISGSGPDFAGIPLPKFKMLAIEVVDAQNPEKVVATAKFKMHGALWWKNLQAKMINVVPDYRRQGIATAVYQYVSKLGNTIKPSNVQLTPGQEMWKGFNRKHSLGETGVAEGQENFNGIDISMEIQKDDEYVDDEDYDNQVIYVTASSKGKELGHVLFAFDGEYLMPQDLEVEERYRGQGIAQTMYDYVKSKGYKIRRSGQQTDAGTGFWDKHKPGKNVWEQGVAEGTDPDKKYTIKKSYTMSKDGVEKAVWYIMDGDFVVDVTDLRRDAKYYADKWNAAEKESSNASQNPHKPDVAESDLDRFKKYIRPVVKTTPKIEKTTNPAGRTTDHVEWIVTSDTGEKRRFDSKKEAQEFYDLCTKQGVAEDMSQRDPVIRTVADFYINDVGSVHKEPLEDYVAQAKDLLSKVEDKSMKAKILDILKQAKKNPYIQGSVITAVGAILAGSVLGSAQKFGLSPTQTNMALQAILNTVIPTMVSRVNGRDWPETLKYTLASVGMGVGSAGMMENFKDGKNPQDKGDSARHGIPKNATISQLKKIRSSDNSSPRKKQLAHWQINMRQGRK